MEPENTPLEKEKHRPKPPFLGFQPLVFGDVFFFARFLNCFLGGYLPPRASPNVENGQLGLRENGRNPLSVEISEK